METGLPNPHHDRIDPPGQEWKHDGMNGGVHQQIGDLRRIHLLGGVAGPILIELDADSQGYRNPADGEQKEDHPLDQRGTRMVRDVERHIVIQRQIKLHAHRLESLDLQRRWSWRLVEMAWGLIRIRVHPDILSEPKATSPIKSHTFGVFRPMLRSL